MNVKFNLNFKLVKMTWLVYLSMLNVVLLTSSMKLEAKTTPLTIVTRLVWIAQPPTDTRPLVTPVPYVVIHHSYMPSSCYDLQQCSRAMRNMQTFHMEARFWSDIGYNFAVGGDGRAYVGRGWTTLGSHARQANNVSIGICLIGDWRHELPSASQLEATKQLIRLGVQLGYIDPEYKLVGHRAAVTNTTCPGEALYKEISTWDHFSPNFMMNESLNFKPSSDMDDNNRK